MATRSPACSFRPGSIGTTSTPRITFSITTPFMAFSRSPTERPAARGSDLMDASDHAAKRIELPWGELSLSPRPIPARTPPRRLPDRCPAASAQCWKPKKITVNVPNSKYYVGNPDVGGHPRNVFLGKRLRRQGIPGRTDGRRLCSAARENSSGGPFVEVKSQRHPPDRDDHNDGRGKGQVHLLQG